MESFSGEIKPATTISPGGSFAANIRVWRPDSSKRADFDPGAKYHVPANVPYTRYFLAFIFAIPISPCIVQGSRLITGPLHRCSIYGNKAAGAKLAKMLAMGESRPWPDALEVMTGQRQMDATAILDYFAPLKKWLDEQNAATK